MIKNTTLTSTIFKFLNFILSKSSLACFMLFFGLSMVCAQEGDYVSKNATPQSEVVTFNQHVYEAWQDKGDSRITIKNNGDFYSQWTQIGNALARKGKRPGVSNQQILYKVKENTFQGNVFYGAYGWWRNSNAKGTYDKAVEFYVVENWDDYRPKDKLVDRGSFTTQDGSVYDVYIGSMTNQPSVYKGINNFTQIKCIRREGDKRSSGAISMFEHFNKWAEEGWPVGNLYEVSFKIEGYSYKGAVNKGSAYVSSTFSTNGTYSKGNQNTSGGNNNSNNNGGGGSGGAISGIYKLKTNWHTNRADNQYAVAEDANWSEVREVSDRGWSSQHWKFEHVQGTNNHYRIQEQYKNRYLVHNTNTGTANVVALNNENRNWNTLIWEVKYISDSFYRIKSTSGNYYLENGNSEWGALSLGMLNESWDSQVWTLEPINRRASKTISASQMLDEQVKKDKVKATTPAKIFKIYPNPSNGIMNVDLTGHDLGAVTIDIYDMSGRVVQTRTTNTAKTIVSLGNLTKGTYLISVNTRKETLSKIIYRN